MKFNLKSHRIKAVPLNRQRFGGITLFLAFEVEKYTGACYTYKAINRLYVPLYFYSFFKCAKNIIRYPKETPTGDTSLSAPTDRQ